MLSRGEPNGADEAVEPGTPTATPTMPTRGRRPGLALPVAIVVLLLATGAAAGRYLVPVGPVRGLAALPSPAAEPPRTPLPSPTLPVLPSVPAQPARPADALAGWASQVSQVLGVPVVAIQAYGYAQLDLRHTDPSCHLGWTTLAGVGAVESEHGQAAGAELKQNGRTSPPIIGPPLDGRQGRPLVRDTDAGAFDGDPTYDRTMGPLGLMPAVWRLHAADADGDGVLDPYDIDDAALALARLLCSGTEDLSQLAGWQAALRRHHDGEPYASSVFAVADDYGMRTRGMGS